jgi:hypothetical protein
MTSINSMVSTNGRLFTVEDLASAEHPALPGKQALVARDAYNGIILWRVMFTDWHPIYIRNKEMPVQIQRRLAAVGDVVYCTPGYSAPITAFEAATGVVIKEHTQTAGTTEFVYDRGVLYVVTGDQAHIFIADEQLLYLRHQAFTPNLSPVKLQDVKQPHLIPSHGFLEAIPQHRSFWTINTVLHYDIPTGHGGINGDILVIDGSRFYEVRGYTHGRTAWFDPRTNGYTLYAGTYGPSATQAVAKRRAAKQGKSKQTRAQKRNALNVAPSAKLWSSSIPLTGKAIALAGDVLFVAGTPVAFPQDDLAKAYEGRMGGILWAASASTGKKLARYALDAPPAWDSLAAANGQLFLSLADGRVICMGPRTGL